MKFFHGTCACLALLVGTGAAANAQWNPYAAPGQYPSTSQPSPQLYPSHSFVLQHWQSVVAVEADST